MRTRVIDSIKFLVELVSPSGDEMGKGDLQWHVNTLLEDNRKLQGELADAMHRLRTHEATNEELRISLGVPAGTSLREYAKLIDATTLNALEGKHKALVDEMASVRELTKAADNVDTVDQVRTKENKEMTEEKQPVFDSVGVEVCGDVKEMYSVTGVARTLNEQGDQWFTTRTTCGRDMVTAVHPSGVYEVAIFRDGELERGYRGRAGSDAYRVYEGTIKLWGVYSNRRALRATMSVRDDGVELVVPEGEHGLPPEAVPRSPIVKGPVTAAVELVVLRAHPEYQQMLSNLTNTQERCTRQEQDIRDLKAAVFSLTSARSALAEELEEMTERYEDARCSVDRLQWELLERESE